ncbi:MAG TPA: YkgJ family cysteine cluster protein, partial [candidate division Zixibacteria bacterium]|nr:YkgJ family cysteine cluster protein [candidate division Zixibacteria bacterium]
MMSSVFYSEGLRFSCIGCGRCCTIPDGVVFLEGEDIRNLAQYLGISEEEFLRKYTRTEGKFVVLNDFPNGGCIFYRRDKGCVVYP